MPEPCQASRHARRRRRGEARRRRTVADARSRCRWLRQPRTRPGRLTEPVRPAGFEALAGMTHRRSGRRLVGSELGDSRRKRRDSGLGARSSQAEAKKRNARAKAAADARRRELERQIQAAERECSSERYQPRRRPANASSAATEEAAQSAKPPSHPFAHNSTDHSSCSCPSGPSRPSFPLTPSRPPALPDLPAHLISSPMYSIVLILLHSWLRWAALFLPAGGEPGGDRARHRPQREGRAALHDRDGSADADRAPALRFLSPTTAGHPSRLRRRDARSGRPLLGGRAPR